MVAYSPSQPIRDFDSATLMAFLRSPGANSTKQPNVSSPAQPNSSWNCTGVPSLGMPSKSLFVWHPLYTGVGIWPARVIPPLSICPSKGGRLVGHSSRGGLWPGLSPGVPRHSLDPTSALGACGYWAILDLLAPPTYSPPTSSNTDPEAQPTPFGSCHLL